MTTFDPAASAIWKDTDSGSPYNPMKNLIRDWAAKVESGVLTLESAVAALQSVGMSGYVLRENVVAATTGNVALTGAYTVDGVTVTNGQRYLAWQQTDPAENGVYVYNSAGAHSRATDMDAAGDVQGSAFAATGGSTYEGWIIKTESEVTTLDTDDIVFYPAMDLGSIVTAVNNHAANETDAHGGTSAGVAMYKAVDAAAQRTLLGLDQLDNTSDADKPVSTAQQTALNAKAPLASPALTGTPTAPTAASGTDTTQIATTAFVQSEVTAALIPPGEDQARVGARIDAKRGYAYTFAAKDMVGGEVDDIATFARASTAWEVGNSEAIDEYASGVMAVAYDTTGNALGVSVRPSAENIWNFTGDLSNAAWVKTNVSITSDDAAGPFGTLMDLAVPTVTSGQHQIRQPHTVPTGPMVFEAVLKPAGYTKAFLALNPAVFGETKIVEFDLSARSTSVTTGTMARSGIHELPDGSLYCWVSDEITTEASAGYICYINSISNYAGDGTSGIHVAYMGVQPGRSYPVGPIPAAAGTDITRAADTLTQSLTLADRFSARVKFDNTTGWADDDGVLFEFSDGTADEAIYVYNDDGVLTLAARASASTAGSQAGAQLPTGTVDIAIAVDLINEEVRWAVNGLAQTTLSLSAVPSGLDQITYGHDAGGADHINAILVEADLSTQAALTDARLTSLTGSTASVAATAIDRDEMIVIGEADGNFSIYTPADPADPASYFRHRFMLDDDASDRQYGYVRQGIFGVTRTDTYAFSQTGYQFWREGAPDQSTRLAVGGVVRGDFQALGGHRGQWMEDHALLLDGITTTIAEGLNAKCRNLELVMKSRFEDTENSNATVAAILNSWRYTAGMRTRVVYDNHITWGVDSGDYPSGLQLFAAQFYPAMNPIKRFTDDATSTGTLLIDEVRQGRDMSRVIDHSSPSAGTGEAVKEDVDRMIYSGPVGFSSEWGPLRGYVEGEGVMFAQRNPSNLVGAKGYWAPIQNHADVGATNAGYYDLTDGEVMDYSVEYLFSLRS